MRYFDTHTAGDIMSRYTSDIDTLRQMISQSIPQCASSLVTIVVVFVGMLQTSWVLTIVMLFTVTGIVLCHHEAWRASPPNTLSASSSLWAH